ncbi:MAG: hypothetical protein IBX44_01965 [Sulfurospirillum sp.]|nr:hypothetical protein [Sulfurospirillum sp.]
MLVIVCIYSFFISLQTTIFVSFLPLCLFSLYYAKYNLAQVVKRVLLFNIFIIFVVISTLIAGNLELALLVFIRSNLIFITLTAFFCKTDMFQIALAMQILRLPRVFVSVFYLSAKAIFLLKMELKRFIKTLKVRGFQAKTSLFSYQIYSNFFGLLIIKSFQNANSIQKMLLIKGFNDRLFSLSETKQISMQEWLTLLLLCTSFLSYGALL